jgi:NADPH:quinone reductase-like Zn-dependent oxidoreductase
MSNQAWQIASPGHLVLTTSSNPPPTPAPNEILIRMHAMSLNYRDILVTDHSPSYPLPSKPNLIPGSDGAGVIELAGSQSHWKAGDRVILHPNTWLSGSPRNYVFEQTLGGAERDGTLQRFMCVDESYVVNAPGGMSLVEASTLFTAGVTAWNALCYGNEEGNGVGFLEGKTVLTQGTGGVSCYAIQVSFLPITSISETV